MDQKTISLLQHLFRESYGGALEYGVTLDRIHAEWRRWMVASGYTEQEIATLWRTLDLYNLTE